jgi:hypothetical protein
VGDAASAKTASAAKERQSGKREGKVARLRKMFSEHGAVFVGYYGAAWLAGYIPSFIVLEAAGVDARSLLDWVGLDQYCDYSEVSPTLINAFLAVEVNEVLDWVRLPVVLATTPRLSAWLKERRAQKAPKGRL